MASNKMATHVPGPPFSPPKYRPGLMVTHDWGQFHTEHGLVDTSIAEVDTRDYQTASFRITSVSQYQAFINNGVMFTNQDIKGCPMQLLSDHSSHTVDSDRPLSGIAKVIYKVTHSVSERQGDSLCDDAIDALRAIEAKTIEQEGQIPQLHIEQFIQKFGSHFQGGNQELGKCFSWMVLADGKCNMDVLEEIAQEIFSTCEEHESHFSASLEGVWYSPQNLVNPTAWNKDKTEILKCVKLRVAQNGCCTQMVSLKEWKISDQVNQVCRLNAGSDNAVPAWDLIHKSWREFQGFKKLATTIKNGWISFMDKTYHCSVEFPQSIRQIEIPGCGNPWIKFVKELGMEHFFPCKLSLQNVRSLCIEPKRDVKDQRSKKSEPENDPEKKELPWRVLKQIMLTNLHCREHDISTFAKSVKPKIGLSKNFGRGKSQAQTTSTNVQVVPHPMDMILLLYLCSDYMLRQVLARKLFMCRLAIPFIVPTAEGTFEMLLWPLRSIIMDWRDQKQGAKEEALVTCKCNMVAFMKIGTTKFSKSKLLNEVLSSSGHCTFFHKGAACGKEQRQISNGTVEMSHFLPAGNQQDRFTEPALFFNLRGNTCDYPTQHSMLMDLATSVVIFVDLGELHQQSVQEFLLRTINKKDNQVTVVLTDCKNHEEDIELLQEKFSELVGDAIENIPIITTYEMDGEPKNISDVNQEVRDAISTNMIPLTKQSVESYATTNLMTEKKLQKAGCSVDEIANHNCSTGKEIAEDLLSEIKGVDICTRKETLLPQQGECLHEISKLLRTLHRSSNKDASLAHKEKIKQEIRGIRQKQSSLSDDDNFTMKVIRLFQYSEETKIFAIRWVQLQLDAISRTSLPQLHDVKNKKWDELTKARSDEKQALIDKLEGEVLIAEKNISSASCGWEHLMREVGQLYEVSKELKKMDREESMFHLSFLPDIVGKQLLNGHPVELMDGDHGFIPIDWVKAVFQSLSQRALHDKKIFVLSVVGIQSSGKSTLLNTMFGLEFAVSAGRCTRGIYAQLLPVADQSGLPFDYMLVLDSEGLRAHELGEQNYEHDNELATLVIGLADLALINLKGENVMEMTDVLQIVVHAFLRMKLADSPHKRQCMFVHQNVSAVNAQEKLAVDRQKLQEHLNNMTRQASVAQGLSSETITSFNRIINFDCQRDVMYFSDLWNGDPPMAAINQGYSVRAAETQQRILKEISQSFLGCITVSDFIQRVEDMWNGVLADDFIFSFRSSLAAKAYIEVEREFARLTLMVEEEILKWVNSHCKVQTENCASESFLHDCCRQLKVALKTKVSELVEQNLKLFSEFFEKHTASEIIIQWKSEKMSSFRMFGDKLERQTESDLENMKTRKLFELRQKSVSQMHEQAIIKKAIAVAVSVRGKRLSDEKLRDQFDELWSTWITDMISTLPRPPCKVLDEFQEILYDKMIQQAILKDFNTQIQFTPLQVNKSDGTIRFSDILKDHITLKDPPFISKEGLKRKVMRQYPSRADYREYAAKAANAMMKTVMQEVENICKQDSTFNPLHGRQIIDLTLDLIAKHNALPFKQAEFALTPQFKAFLAIRVACCAAPKFDEMNQRFEDKHGVQAKMEAYKGRIFLLFKNTVKDASAEVMASEHFCETIKARVKEHISEELEQSVIKELYQAVGNLKYDLIIKMLDEIAERESFSALLEYASAPFGYAKSWMQEFGTEHIFSHKKDQTKYSEFVDHHAENIFSTVSTSVSDATKSVSGIQGSDQYSTWIAKFCESMTDTMSLDPLQLSVTTNCTIKSFSNFQNFLETELQNLKENIKTEFHEETALAIWLDQINPFEKVCNRLWGCVEHCPFCREPCQHSIPDHQSSHHCVQHKPPAVRGVRNRHTQSLTLSTCTLKVVSGALFRCNLICYQCQKTEFCDSSESVCEDDLPEHDYREYKKYLPRWDIAPDTAGEASKYWKWIVCKFEKELLEDNPGTMIEIPDSWKLVSKQEAKDSLRIYH